MKETLENQYRGLIEGWNQVALSKENIAREIRRLRQTMPGRRNVFSPDHTEDSNGNPPESEIMTHTDEDKVARQAASIESRKKPTNMGTRPRHCSETLRADGRSPRCIKDHMELAPRCIGLPQFRWMLHKHHSH